MPVRASTLHLVARHGGVPCRLQLVEQERSCGTQAALGARQLDLGERALRERLGRSTAASCPGRDRRVRRAPVVPTPSPTAETPAASSVKLGNCDSGVRTTGRVTAGWMVRLAGHERLVHRVVERPRSAHPGRVPGVVERDRRLREPAQPERAVVAECAAEHPLAVLRTAPPGPTTRHREPVDAVDGRPRHPCRSVRRPRR